MRRVLRQQREKRTASSRDSRDSREKDRKRTYNRDNDRILAANETFYSAFSTLDYEGMEDLWLPDNSSICIFPNSKPLRGYSAILKSWEHAVASMDGNNLRNWMAPDSVRFEYIGTNRATIVCDELIFFSSERLVGGRVVRQTDVVNRFKARNMFKKVGNRWYLCYHEAFMEKRQIPISDNVRKEEDILEEYSSCSEDSQTTFLTMMTTGGRAERKRDRRRQAMAGFMSYWGCCAGDYK